MMLQKSKDEPANRFHFSLNKEARRQGALAHLWRRHHCHSEKIEINFNRHHGHRIQHQYS